MPVLTALWINLPSEMSQLLRCGTQSLPINLHPNNRGFSPTSHYFGLPGCVAITKGLGCKQLSQQCFCCKLKCQNDRKAKRNMWDLQNYTKIDLVIGRNSDIMEFCG